MDECVGAATRQREEDNKGTSREQTVFVVEEETT